MNRRLNRAMRFNPFSVPGLLFAADDAGGGGGAGGDAAATAAAAAAAAAAKAGGSDWTPPASQADLDRIINQATAKVHGKYTGFDDFKAKATKFDDSEAAKAPELERTRTAALKEGGDAARAEITRERVLDKIEVAAAGKFTDVEDARLRLGQRVDEFIGKDGTIDTAAITAAVDKLLTDKPHLAAEITNKVPSPGWVGIGTGGSSTGDEGVQPGLGRLQHAYAQSPHAQK